MLEFFQGIGNSLYKMFIVEDRWQMILGGLGTTLFIAFAATLLGIVLGFLVAIVRSTYEMNLKKKRCRKFGDVVMKFFNVIANIYITVIRGTPLMVQVIIMFFIVFASESNGLIPAILTFGINSGAYVSEVIRGGIGSVDFGQTEAGRSLGLSQIGTLRLIVLPQAIKNILPALCNEAIAVLKETSIVGMVAVVDLTRAGDLVRSRTMSPYFTLISVAIVYFVLVYGLTKAVGRLERRLAQSDRN